MVREIRDSIDAAFKHDPAARSTIDVLLCYPGAHAVILHRIWIEGGSFQWTRQAAA